MPVRKFRKKPIVIEAVQWTGLNYTEVERFMGEPLAGGEYDAPDVKIIASFLRAADPGDWIIKGIMGEFYPCKPGIFEATYEAVS